MKLADYVADFLAKRGIGHAFVVSGGASLHLIHGLADHPDITYVTTHHEQAAAMAADGYARTTGNIGVAVATSGPGATNLLTGIACSYYDSVPMLCLTGQVSTFRMAGHTGVRQIGFQETPIVDMVAPITKYAVQIKKPEDIRYELEKALHIAQSGRPGPVLVDIPDNYQRADIAPDTLMGYTPQPAEDKKRFPDTRAVKQALLAHIEKAKRPVLVMGWGVRLSGMEAEAVAFAEALNIPVALTWGAADVLPAAHPLCIGTFGTHGARHASFAVQNADLVLSLGARMDTKATGSPVNTYAREAVKIMVDLDPAELGKFSAFDLKMDMLVEDDLRVFFPVFPASELKSLAKPYTEWLSHIAAWKKEFAEMDSAHHADFKLDPYQFIDALSTSLPDNANIFVDTGCAVAWTMQRIALREGQRLFHDCNNTAMGWALPASIGGYFAQPNRPLICLSGDGSLMMTLYELATVKHHRIPLKLFVINNAGYAMIRQTQDQWLGSHYHASSQKGGLSFPDFRQLATAFGMEYAEVDANKNLANTLQQSLKTPGSVLTNVIIPAEARVIPQVRFGRPNEDMEPLLPRDAFHKHILVDPLEVSKS